MSMSMSMSMSRRVRRIVAVALVVLGGLLLFFAPKTPGGFTLLILGVLVELVGIYLERRHAD